MLLLMGSLIGTGLAAYDQAQLTALCDIYYSECETTTNCDYASTISNACDSYTTTATGACTSETSNNDFAKCFMNYDSDYISNCTEYKQLAVCLYEETKDISEFSCYNGGTTAVECASSLSGVVFDLNSVDNDVNNVQRGREYWTNLTVDYGSFNITNPPPKDCVPFGDRIFCTIDPWLIPHMNLHACLMTDQQKTCSGLMLANTESNSSVTLTDSNSVNPSDGPFELSVTFQNPGTYRLIAHIQFYEDIGNDERTFWDMANGIDLTVVEPNPTNAPTVKLAPSGTDTGSLTAIIICLTILACYCLLYAYYKFVYEPRKYVFDNVEYDLDEDDSYEVTGGDDEELKTDGFVTTGVQEAKED